MKTQPANAYINPVWFFAKIGIICVLGVIVGVQVYSMFWFGRKPVPQVSRVTVTPSKTRSTVAVTSSKTVTKSEQAERALPKNRKQVRQELAKTTGGEKQKGSKKTSKPTLTGALMNPETYAMIKDGFKHHLDGPYGKLYNQLGLDTDRLQTLRGLLAEKELTLLEGFQLAGSSRARLDNDALNALRNESDGAIRELLGDAAFASYKDYENTLPARNHVDVLEKRLSYQTEPLTSDQYNALVAALSGLPDPNIKPGSGAWLGNYTPDASDASLEIARSILTPSQFAIYSGDYEEAKASDEIFQEYAKKFADEQNTSNAKQKSKSKKSKSK